MMAKLMEAGMIFIPSMGGKSHCPEEYTSKDDIKAGCDLLLHFLKTLSTKDAERQRIL